jgi:hypothetical protein
LHAIARYSRRSTACWEVLVTALVSLVGLCFSGTHEPYHICRGATEANDGFCVLDHAGTRDCYRERAGRLAMVGAFKLVDTTLPWLHSSPPLTDSTGKPGRALLLFPCPSWATHTCIYICRGCRQQNPQFKHGHVLCMHGCEKGTVAPRKAERLDLRNRLLDTVPCNYVLCMVRWTWWTWVVGRLGTETWGLARVASQSVPPFRPLLTPRFWPYPHLELPGVVAS